tara:strand:- start:1891 stop:3039 length:1149 start_codon:yes stop_codon:yes gene_type:complete
MIKLSEPFFFGKELEYLKKSLKDKWISSNGKIVKKFEKKLQKYTTGKYNLATINCTSALQLAVRLLDPKKNEEIIVPSITFAATINSILYNNCKPIFFDCDDALLLDKKKFYLFIKKNTYFKKGFTFNKKTKKKILAIIVVNTFGNLFNFDNFFVNFCKKRNIKIIEDAAESLASKDLNKKRNAGIEYSCYSFNGNKLITSGGGGLISIKNERKYQQAIYLASQAKKDSIQFIHDDVGYNFLLSNLHACIGLSQLLNINKVLKRKEEINRIYKNKINKINGLEILTPPKNCKPNNWLNVLIVNEKLYGLSKNQVIQKFYDQNIETRSLWYPNHLQKPFKKFQNYEIKKSNLMFKSCLCLPSSYGLQKSDQSKIIKLLKNKFN